MKKEKKNLKTAMDKFVEQCPNANCYIIMTDKGFGMSAKPDEVLSMIACLIGELKEQIPKEMFEQCVELGFMDDDEISKKVKETNELKKITKILRMLEEMDNE
jgi:hypothetical protein